jgi:hypothetical protein
MKATQRARVEASAEAIASLAGHLQVGNFSEEEIKELLNEISLEAQFMIQKIDADNEKSDE